MKKIILLLILFTSAIAHAQTWEEWFRQKETQKKYLLQQIAAFKIYLSYAEKGYNIANTGLTTIRSIKRGDFNLHNDFFNSLSQINPAIKKWSRVRDITTIQIQIIKQTKETINSVKEANQFTTEEMDYCKTVFKNLLTECLHNIDELIKLTTADNYQMKDDERIKRIESIYIDMQDKYAFSSTFSREMQLLSIQRSNELNDIEISKALDK
jgi:hypothetical protein